jgi:WD40 repeat protein
MAHQKIKMCLQHSIVRISVTTICAFVLFTAAQGQAGPSWPERITFKLAAAPRSLSYTRDGQTLAVGQNDGQVTLWDAKTGELRKALASSNDSVEALFFIPAGDRLISITARDQAVVWSLPDGKQLAKLDAITPISGISGDGNWLVNQDPKHVIVVWDLTTLKRKKELGKAGLDGAVNINFTADGRSIAVAMEHRLDLIDVSNGKLTELPIRGKPQGMKIQMTGKNTAVMTMGALDDDSAIIHRVVPSTKSALLAVGRGWYGKPQFIDVWDYVGGKMLGRFKPQDDGQLAQFSSDDSMVAIAGAASVSIWKVATGEQLANMKATQVFDDTPLAKGSTLFTFSPVARELALVDGLSIRIFAPK